MNKAEYEALKTIHKEIEKMYVKYSQKVAKEEEKVKKPYITFKGDRYYSINELYESFACDGMTLGQYHRLEDKLQAKLDASEESAKTKNWYIKKTLEMRLYSYESEIEEMEYQEQLASKHEADEE